MAEAIVKKEVEEITGDPELDKDGNPVKKEEENADGVTTPKEGESTEGVKEGDKGTLLDPKDGDADEGQGAPEEYEDWTMPEGVELDKESSVEFNEVGKDLNLTQDQAQKLVDLYSKKQGEAVAAQQDQWATTQAEWVDSAKADKEFGGNEFDANMSVAKQALDKFGTPELKEALNFSGLGSNPEVIRFFYKVGKAIGEDKLAFGGSANEADKAPLAQRLFPNQN